MPSWVFKNYLCSEIISKDIQEHVIFAVTSLDIIYLLPTYILFTYIFFWNCEKIEVMFVYSRTSFRKHLLGLFDLFKAGLREKMSIFT